MQRVARAFVRRIDRLRHALRVLLHGRPEQPQRPEGRWRERAAALTARVRSLDARLGESETRQRRWEDKARAEQGRAETLAALVAGLREQKTTLAGQVQRFKAQHERTHRSVLSSDVIRGLLPSRLAVAQARALLPEARERLERFSATSATYRAVSLERDRPAPPELVRCTTDPLPFWIPALRQADAEPGSRWLNKQHLPYRGILQTREVSLGGVMLDIGANVGHMSVSRVALGDVTAAYCAEPDPLNYDSLVRTVAENRLEGLVLPDRVAIGATTGTARLRRGRFPGGHHIVSSGDSEAFEVDMLALDDWVRRHAIPLPLVTFVKVDVQGLEPQVLDGAGYVLAHRHIAWQLEISPQMLQAITSVEDHAARLASLFTHFTDLNRAAIGDRGRPTAELAEALAYLGRDGAGQTDILLFNLVR